MTKKAADRNSKKMTLGAKGWDYLIFVSLWLLLIGIEKRSIFGT
jgi:hypothetical protein